MRPRESALESSWLRRAWDKFSDYGIVLIILLALAGVAFGVVSSNSSDNNSASSKTSSAAAAKSSALAATYAKRLTIFQHAAHQQSTAQQAQIIALDQQIIGLEEEVKYIAGVVAFEGGVIENSLAEHSGELTALSALEQQVLTLDQTFSASLSKIPGITDSLQGGQDTIVSEYNQILAEIAALKAAITGQAQ